MTNNYHHLIVEGAELVGKSYIISEIYNFLEAKYSSKKFPYLLDGCHWFNTDIGIYGSKQGPDILKNYLQMAKTLKDKNLIFEKFHLTDKVYASLYLNEQRNYKKFEEKLLKMNFKIIYLEVDDTIKIFDYRLKDRLNLYPHYERIAQQPINYLKQQKQYQEYIKETRLPVLKINTSILPNPKIINNILLWLKEK